VLQRVLPCVLQSALQSVLQSVLQSISKSISQTRYVRFFLYHRPQTRTYVSNYSTRSIYIPQSTSQTTYVRLSLYADNKHADTCMSPKSG